MKKRCKGCKADEDNTRECSLGFVRERVITTTIDFSYYGKPAERCPKPTTTKEFVRLLGERGEQQP